MRALAVVLVAAFVIALSGAAPVSAQESSTPGIWINPELGLATPEDAARRYKGPFHAWWIDEDDPRRQEPDWRERAFLLFGEDWPVALRIWSQVAARDMSLAKLGGYAPKTGEWHDKDWPVEIPPPPPGPAALRVESCAGLLAAYRAGLRPRPALELAWHGSRLSHFRLRVHRFFECLALEHLKRLRPLEGDFEHVPTFWGDRATMLRLSPVVFGMYPSDDLPDYLAAEEANTPHEVNVHKIRGRPHAEDRIVGGPWWTDPGTHWWTSMPHSLCARDSSSPIAWPSAIEESCNAGAIDTASWDWMVMARGRASRMANFYFAPEVLVEDESTAHTLMVLGVGGLPNSEGFVLVVMTVERWKRGSASAYDLLMPLVLNYDPELDMFRVINFDDLDLVLPRDVP